MRKWLLLIWLLAPVGLAAFHFGPGSALLARDLAASRLAAARTATDNGDDVEAEKQYQLALDQLPADAVSPERRNQIRLAQARVRMVKGELVEAIEDFHGILADAVADPEQATLEQETRSSLARAQYYAGWIMRLEGAAKEDWKFQTEASRQNYRLLAESALSDRDDEAGKSHRQNLEAVIRLARMDLKELQAMPLPQECQCVCKSGCVSEKVKKGKKKRSGEGQGAGEQKEGDARGKGAGTGKRPEGVGS
ncbi:hypothetical protein JXA32_04940 [Candidatus Sumerlaeota bacterium]|nr:hypothetical protein [Candidatus Sumerlaeota bacterium]